jgi:hypothetical protein
MHESELLSPLIGDIYDAALNPALWVGVLAETRAYNGGCDCTFLEGCGRQTRRLLF